MNFKIIIFFYIFISICVIFYFKHNRQSSQLLILVVFKPYYKTIHIYITAIIYGVYIVTILGWVHRPGGAPHNQILEGGIKFLLEEVMVKNLRPEFQQGP